LSTLTPSKQQTDRGFFIALASAVVLSFTGILIRMVSEDYHLPALILALWRDIFVVVCMLPIGLVFKPSLFSIRLRDGFFLVGFGIVLALFNILWTLAVTLTGAAVATVLVYSSAGFTALLGLAFDGASDCFFPKRWRRKLISDSPFYCLSWDEHATVGMLLLG